jgi:hypothetical protein
MPRSRRKLEITFVSLLLAAGGLWVVGKLTLEVSKGFYAAPLVFAGGAFLGVAVLVVAVWIARSLFRLVRRRMTREQRLNVRKSLFDKAQATTERNLSSLVRKRRELVRPDAHGNLKMEAWLKEVDYFLASSIEPFLSPDEQLALPEYSAEIASLIEEAVRKATVVDERAGP